VNDEQTNGNAPGSPPDDVQRPRNGYLEVLFGPMAGRTFTLAKDMVVVGRADDADFVLDDPTVSRRHLAIRRLPDGLHLTDLGGGNGTLVNGKTVSELILDDGMTVEAGTTVMTFHAGAPPGRSRDDGSLHLRDTQELPVLGKGHPGASQTSGTATQPEMRQARRHGIPPSSLSQLVSWVVVLALVVGGGMLALSLLDHSVPPRVDSKESATPASRNPRLVAPKLPVDEGRTLSVASTPDVAQERLRVAVELETAGNLAGALAVYEEIDARYPEFIPSAGPTVTERVDLLKKKITFGELLDRAQALFEKADAQPKELQDMENELGVIPASDKEFGDRVHRLAQALRERAKAIEKNKAEERLREVDGELPPAPEAGTDTPPPVETPSTGADEARSNAKSLYRKGKFDEAAALLREAGSGRDGDSLGRLAGRIEAFGKTYQEAVATARDAGLEEDAIDLLEKARVLDADLYGGYKGELDDLLASTSVTLAQRRLSDGDYASARRMLDTARKYRSSNKDVGKLENLFSFKAAQLVKQAREASDPAAAVELADQAIALAGANSAAGNEAAQIKKKMAEK